MIRVPFTPPAARDFAALLARLPAPSADTQLTILPWAVPPTCHRDLTKERLGHKDLIHDLNLAWFHDNNPQLREFRFRLQALFASDPVIANAPHKQYFMSKAELYERACKVMAAVLRIIDKYAIPPELHVVVWEATGELVPIFLHLGMVIPTFESLATRDQQAYWLPKLRSLSAWFAFAQTEVGAGSDVQAIETTAELDVETDEWVLNTPTITSGKCWPGALAHTANHALVMAQVRVRGTQYGVHPIIVQLREDGTHEPKQGIKLMDLGPKIGFNVMDNGILYLTNVRVPRTHLLGKSLSVSANGTSVRPVAPPALLYKTLLQMRAGIVTGASYALWRACTIATRYSVIRRQFGGQSHAQSTQIIDYPTQQVKLATPMALAVALDFAGAEVNHLVTSAGVDPVKLRQAHVLSSCLKVVATRATADHLEKLRRALGGHGYARSGGIAELWTTYVQMVTVEGENTVLAGQVARAFGKGGEDELFANMDAGGQGQKMVWTDAQSVAEYLNGAASRAITQWRQAGKTNGPSTQNVAMDAMCMTAGWALVYNALARGLSTMPAAKFAHIFEPLAVVLAGHIVLECLPASALIGSPLSSVDVQAGHAAVAGAIATLRPYLVPLTDAAGFTDRELVSAVGGKDGRVYETILEWAKDEPLNKELVNPAILRELVGPVMGKLGTGMIGKSHL
ncbi:acyl-CoA dehydrogenase/oxidase [Catenaria anguillulae PL171]|uniref:Acyl-coenzyme A oxidase n=1 Tax=Catenaria anguillulae PL171 TaxID=765915 RepID=A0A1Y2HF40_9FUNG|nr:acyl-CoA dehydrogenase/oxidase [Catenaria anguillulae PL171]